MGCAGPATPFGSMNWPTFLNPFGKSNSGLGYRISFSPERQVLHDSTDLDIIVEDVEGVPEEPDITVVYNGKDVTRQFLSKADREYIDHTKRRLKLSVKKFRLKLLADHQITASYKPKNQTEPVTVYFEPPTCSAFNWEGRLAKIPGFKVDDQIVDFIDGIGHSQKISPFYIAGLIAQESSFDSTAVSRSKALGLTQVTSLGEAEIISSFEQWPRYPGISDMNWYGLRNALKSGDINSANEWRLDPSLSIRGGVEYLKFLSGYWERPDKQLLFRQSFADSDVKLSEVILASYNSGASRVSQALEEKGPEYLKSSELKEARKYVRRIASFCDFYSQRGQTP